MKEKDEKDDAQSEGEEIKALERSAVRYVVGYRLDFAWCKQAKFLEFLDLIKFQGWEHVLVVKSDNYLFPLALDEFCDNCEFDDGTCYSKVNGVEIEFDAEKLGKILKVPNAGFDTYFKGPVTMKVMGYTKTEIIKFVGGKKGANIMNHNDLTPLNKLLFNLVKKFVVPRTQKKNELCFLDMTIIFCLVKKIKINFPSLMLQHLEHTVPKGYKVGYGALLASVMEELGVELVDFYGALPEKSENVINESTLRGLSLGVVAGKCVVVEPKKATLPKEVEDSPKTKEPVRKSRRISAGTLPKTSVDEPMEISDKEDDEKEVDSVLLDRVEQAEGKLQEMQLKIKALEAAVKKQDKNLADAVTKLENRIMEAAAGTKADMDKILKLLEE